MEKDALIQVIQDHHLRRMKPTLIKREVESKLLSAKKNPYIIVISGMRRAGKSTLLSQIRTAATPSDYYLNFDDDRLSGFTIDDFQRLHEALIELYGEQDTYFFDEIQSIKGWESYVRRLHDEGKKVYVTGSNASMLSMELGTKLTGRHLQFALFPFSFKEYLSFKGLKAKTKNLTTTEKSLLKRGFDSFQDEGGMPEYLTYHEESHLSTLYENIVYRDLIARYTLPDDRPLREIITFCASNIGKPLSYNRLRAMAGLSNAATVKDYLDKLQNTYLLFLISKYDKSLSQQNYAPKKTYFIDQKMARLVGFRTGEDKGRMLENTVLVELKRRGLEVYYHRGEHECDFLVRTSGRVTAAIQVTLKMAGNEERELAGLLEAMSEHHLKEGLIITEDEEGTRKVEGKKILLLPAWKWLLLETT